MSQRWVKKTTLFDVKHIFSVRYIFHTDSYIRVLLGLLSWPTQKGAKLPLIKGGGGVLGNYKKTRTVSFVDNWITVFERPK